MSNKLFEDITEFPNSDSQRKYKSLVGLDDIKEHLIKEAEILLSRNLLVDWSKKQHGKVVSLVKIFKDRHPLFIFAGDIGTGKSTLAETFGDQLARKDKLSIVLYQLSLGIRGSGAVGEMTRLVSNAFEEVRNYAKQLKQVNNKYSSACIFLIDEADALAQSRELDQMHHEDRAGVNALIRGIDSLTKAHLPVLVVMCTNRLRAIDPAIRRRAAATFTFDRPNEDQRFTLFKTFLEDAGLSEEELHVLAKISGKNGKRSYGCTYSDITQKILPLVILNSYPDKPVTFKIVERAIKTVSPTAPFNEYQERNHE